ncbi:MAG: methyl-accepting chemotaxis protein [Thiohalomonadales bacterium]
MGSVNHKVKLLVPLAGMWALMVTVLAASAGVTAYMWVIAGIALVAGLAGTSWVAGEWGASITRISDVLKSSIDGNWDSRLNAKGSDETSQLENTVNLLLAQLKLKWRALEEEYKTDPNIETALNAVTANVMIADEQNTIVYMNSALSQMFNNAKTNIQTDFPNFEPSKLLGTNMGQFHKQTTHQPNILNNLTGSYTTQMEVGGSTFSLIANPIFDDAGKRTGSVVEWVDRTIQLSIENEVLAIVNAAADGDLSNRIEINGKEGFSKVIAEGVNQLTDSCGRIIQDTSRVLAAMASGKLTEKIEHEYHGDFAKLQHIANTTTAKFIEVIAAIQQSANNISTGAKEINSNKLDLSQHTKKQANGLAKTASNMQLLTDTTKQNADYSNQASQLAIGAKEQAEKGSQEVRKVITAMAEIDASSKKVAEIVAVIDEIAFQTNLLALNAAVEAARAGEQGRGFAVVASEVRNLAQRSANAAKEIKEHIQEGVDKVTEGSKLVDATGNTLIEIETVVNRVSDIIAEISAASQKQSRGIEDASKSVIQLDNMTQQNITLVKEASATNTKISGQTKNLNSLINFFETGNKSEDNMNSITNIYCTSRQ